MKHQTRQLTLAALCIALGVVLPQLLHGIPNAGSIWCPMHIPVLLAGFVAGPIYGAIVGAITPFLSSLLTGMPGAMILPGMMVELAVYGLAGGYLYQKLNVKKPMKFYICLITAMILGRIASGLSNGLLFRAGSYTFQGWITASFVTALPGILVHILLIPVLLMALDKANLLDR